MKKNLSAMFSILLLAFVLFPGCRKEVIPDNEKALSAETESELQFHHGDECRLTSDISDFAENSYTYNERGLVDQWNISWVNGYAKMKYDEHGRLVKSRFYSEGALVNTIVFSYQGDRVVKETWYDGDTKTKVNEVFYFYNSNGKVWKSKSIMQDYSSIYKYTPDGGSVKGWYFYVGGKLSYTQLYTYLPPHHKQPNSARHGVIYGFIFVNGWFDNSRWYSTSEKDISYDENGENPVVVLDQDPSKSIVSFNKYNYVTATDFFDVLTKEYVHFRFGYENCACDDGNDDKNIGGALQKTPLANNNKFNPQKFLMLDHNKSIKEQMKKLRNQFGR